MENRRTLKDWIIATRPWSFPASVTPVLATTAYIFWQQKALGTDISWTNAVLSLILLMLLHAGGNLVSDYSDHVEGVDKADGPNGVTWIFSGLFSPKTILHYGYALLAAAAAIGAVILINSSFEAIWVGIAGLILSSCYPWLKGHALGDADVLLGFALLPAAGTAFVMTGLWLWEPVLLSLSYGPITVAILHANNTRDIENDAQAGLTTLSIAIGRKASRILYLFLLAVPYFLVAICFLAGLVPVWSFITFLTLPIAVKNSGCMLSSASDETRIAGLDQQTAQLQMMFGILFTISFIIAAFL